MKKLMLLLRLMVSALLLALPATVLPGCGFLPDTGNPPAACELPAPEAGWTMQPTFTADQQPRQDEVCRYVTEWWKARGYVRKATTQMPESGDVYDWMDASSVAGSNKEPPPPPSPAAMALPEGVFRQRMEIEDYPERRGPDGTIPILRPDFWAYVGGDSGASSLKAFISQQAVGSPPPSNRLYAGIIAPVPNRGANVNINSYGGGIELFTLSVNEMVVGCKNDTGEMWQQVGVAASRDYVNLKDKYKGSIGDSVLRLRVEFLTDGPGHTGPDIGGWDDIAFGFTYVSGLYPAGAAFATSTLSTVGGTQYESLYQIALKNGDWWVAHNGNWLGYYRGELFTTGTSNLLAAQACEVDWYGEVYADLRKLEPMHETWTWTPMGSGHYASDGWQNAAYFRNPTYVGTDASESSYWPDIYVQPILPPSYNAACYSSTPYQSGSSPWDRFFYFGGPGTGEPTCTY